MKNTQTTAPKQTAQNKEQKAQIIERLIEKSSLDFACCGHASSPKGKKN